MLEGIKDRELFPSKYDSQRITENTPNILMVFSNDEPNTSKLANDLWTLFFIENYQLKERFQRSLASLVVLGASLLKTISMFGVFTVIL